MLLDVTDRNEMKQDTVIGVAMRHFDAAFKKIKPSVSEKVGLLFYAHGVLPNGDQCCNDSVKDSDPSRNFCGLGSTLLESIVIK